MTCFSDQISKTRIPAASCVQADLDNIDKETKQLSNDFLKEGRLGPFKVNIDLPSISGELEICPQQTFLLGNGNFTSVRADVCVYSKKWMYEVTLGSGGIQQLGWTTINTQWTTEEGVGDHSNSYAYDGSRVKKWNVQKHSYGKPWEKGDIVGCCIDLDEGTMTFYQNGECLGVAFKDIKNIHSRNKQSRELMAYFPAVSLSHNESCWINFGQHPFMYPVEGYRPIQLPDAHIFNSTSQRKYLCDSIYKLTLLLLEQKEAEEDEKVNEAVLLYNELLMHLVECSCIEMDGKLVVQQCDELVDAVVDLHQKSPDAVTTLLKFLPLAVDSNTLRTLLAFIVHRLCFKCSVIRPVQAWQPAPGALPQPTPAPGCRKQMGPQPSGNKYLRCLVQFLTKEVIEHWVAEESSVHLDIMNFLSVKPPNPEEARELFPHVWWNGCLSDDGHDLSEVQVERFFETVKGFAALVSTEDSFRTSLLQRVAQHSPETFSKVLDFCVNTMRTSCRMYSTLGRGLHGDSVMRLFFATLEYFDQLPEPSTDLSPPVPSAADPALCRQPLCTWPFHLLMHEDKESKDMQRFGGLLSYLRKDYPLKATTADAMDTGIAESQSSADASQSGGPEPMDCSDEGESDVQKNWDIKLPEEVDYYHTIFKRLTQLYSYGVKDKVSRATSIVTTKGRLAEKMLALLKENRPKANDLREELYTHIRKCTWEYIVFFGNIREEQMLRLASRAILVFEFYEESILFRYLPNYLLELVVNVLQLLRKSCKQYVPLVASRPEIVLFLLGHIQDSRIVNPDVKELILSSVNSLMETDARRREVVVSILQQPEKRPYIPRFLFSVLTCFNDGHNWVTVIDIILKFYSGLGFGFPEDDEADELDLDLFLEDQLEPCPVEQHVKCSQFFTAEFLRFCEEQHVEANNFLNSVFNHLNWSMSELAISLAEQRAGISFLPGDINSTRKCSIMFEMCCKLLRILEFSTDILKYMFVPESALGSTHVPSWSAVPNVEERRKVNASLVAEVVAHALNRFTCGDGCQELDRVIALDLRALQGLKKARILAPVAGILINMVLDGPGNTSTSENLFVHNMATNTDRKWTLESISFLKRMDWKEELGSNNKAVCNKLGLLHSTILHDVLEASHRTNDALRDQQQRDMETGSQQEEDDNTCAICCSASNNRRFKPCEHKSCAACISRHLLNCKKCFFCNAEITAVEELSDAQ